MKLLEVIKNYFAPGYDKKLANPVEDAKILSAIGRESTFLNARNGLNYYYYFAKEEQDTPVAQYLFVRNGVKIKKHNSQYYYTPRLGLRVRACDIKDNETNKKFIDAICPDSSLIEKEELEARIAVIRRQMRGQVK